MGVVKVENNQLNREDIITNISYATGYTKKSIREILETQDSVFEEAIRQGYNIKNHKLFKLELKHQDESKGWDGLQKRYYTIPEKELLKFKPLSRLTRALEERNEAVYTEDGEVEEH